MNENRLNSIVVSTPFDPVNKSSSVCREQTMGIDPELHPPTRTVIVSVDQNCVMIMIVYEESITSLGKPHRFCCYYRNALFEKDNHVSISLSRSLLETM